MKILLVEDEKKTSRFVKKALQEQGFVVDVSHNGDDGYLLATTQPYDVLVLDIMLPGRDGLSILKNLREKKNAVPVILLTARGELNERIEGLNAGADDYLAKPFFVEELIARIHALSRRNSDDQLSLLSCSDLVVNLLTRDVHRGETAIELTAREFNLLEVMMRAPGRVFTRTQLLERVWGYDFDPQTNLVDVNIQRLRKKVDAETDVHLIETVRGVGYRMTKQE
ncbi:MAG: two-component system OmpR family response regulator [Candidatus Promineifilaceae bacterium]|jgi:two-component system OmpR family response regulator